MKSVLRCIAGLSAVLTLGGCAGVAAQPSVSASGSAPAPTSPSAAMSSTASASASVPAGVQVFEVPAVGIQISLSEDFVILDKSKAKDETAEAYWEQMSERTGQSAASLKSLASASDGVAADGTGTIVSIRKRPDASVPSVDAVAKDLKRQNIKGGKASELDTPLGKGTRVSLSLGTNHQEFIYLQGPNSVVGVNVSSSKKADAIKVLDQILPTIKAL